MYASPATISRAGMVFIDSEKLGYKPFWQRWLRQRRPNEHKILQVCFRIQQKKK